MKNTILFFAAFVIVTSSAGVGIQAAEQKMPLDLNGTEWSIVISDPSGIPKPEDPKDTLSFNDGMFYAEGFGRKGFAPDFFSVTLKDGMTIWRGTQRMLDEITLWRGDVQGNVMRGMISARSTEDEKEVSNYSFTGTLVKGTLAALPPVAAAAPAAETAGKTAKEKKQIPGEKKRGIFGF